MTLASNKPTELKVAQHPYYTISREANYEKILANFLAMSQAFPYIQAGSHYAVAQHFISKNRDIPEAAEITSVVGTFLCWDEMGGLYPTITRGLQALPGLLDTKYFHSNILKKDCFFLFGKNINPNYSGLTQDYLDALYQALSSTDNIERVAMMVTFEAHADTMIQALWHSLCEKFQCPRDKLAYFRMHVGGDDPAEAYHVETTERMIQKIIHKDQHANFQKAYEKSMQLHIEWCADVVNQGEYNYAAAANS